MPCPSAQKLRPDSPITPRRFSPASAPSRLDHEFWRDRSETYRGAMEDDKVNAGGRFIVIILPHHYALFRS
jgi:hypothetical protein